MANIVRVITIKCTGHNSHGSCCLTPISQGTLPQHPWNPFLIFLKKFTLWEVKCRVMKWRVGKRQGFSLPWMGLRGGKDKSIQKKKSPMGVVEGCPGYWCGTAALMAIVASAFNRAHPNYVLPVRPFKSATHVLILMQIQVCKASYQSREPFCGHERIGWHLGHSPS